MFIYAMEKIRLFKKRKNLSLNNQFLPLLKLYSWQWIKKNVKGNMKI